jgi:hypothetical protein
MGGTIGPVRRWILLDMGSRWKRLMPLNTPALTRSPKPQFSLRALLGFTTAVSFLLGLGYWIGWFSVCGAILRTTSWLQIGVTLWPITIALLWSFEADSRVYGKCVLALASFFIAHLFATILCLDVLRSSQTTVDSSACHVMLARTMNWTVPSVAIGVATGIYMGLTARTTLAYLVGCFLAAGGLLGFTLLGLGLGSQPLGLSRLVWWL